MRGSRDKAYPMSGALHCNAGNYARECRRRDPKYGSATAGDCIVKMLFALQSNAVTPGFRSPSGEGTKTLLETNALVLALQG